MALKTKAKIASIGEALGKKSVEFTFQDPALIDAPNSAIVKLDGSARQLPDPEKWLKPSIGVERIVFQGIRQVVGEKVSSTGEAVYELANKDPRVRFGGSVSDIVDFGGSDIGRAISMTSGLAAFVEITFFGTGLNLLSGSMIVARGWDAVIDGQAPVDIGADGTSTLTGRDYRGNTIVPVASGLSLGIHTVRLIIQNGGSLPMQGLEILNESTDIQIPEGSVLAAGNKFRNSALTTTSYASGFEGTPTLNGKGGRVVVYITPEGNIKKEIQQTEDTQLNLSAADHSNEEVIQRINWREFGSGRTDDFTSLTSSVSDKAFTLDDGVTSLAGDDVRTGSEIGVRPNSTGDYVIFTFVGTGLDIFSEVSVTSSNTHEVFVDDVSIGFMNQVDGTGVEKIVSGLPYGSHVVRIEKVNTDTNVDIDELIVYGPKKPTIPSDSQEIQEYFLMADFVANTVGNRDRISTGVLKKYVAREFRYGTSWTTGLTLNLGVSPAGFYADTNASGATLEYTFWGTGFDFRMVDSSVDRSSSILIEIDDGSGFQTFNTANFGSIATDTESDTYGMTFTAATGILNTRTGTSRGGWVVQNLPLQAYTVRLTNQNAQRMSPISIDIITPVHYPNAKVGSMALGQGVQLQTVTESQDIDLTKAKAWIKFDQANSEVLSSHNISAVVDAQAGEYLVYFEKPFKNSNYMICGSGARYGTGTAQTLTIHFDDVAEEHRPKRNHCRIYTQTNNGQELDGISTVVFFGELEDEGVE